MKNGKGSAFLNLALFGAAVAGVVIAVRRERQMDFRGKTVLIAGASRGLGLELARGFAREGANIVLLARDRDELTQVSSEFAHRGDLVSVLQCDIRSQEEVQKSAATVIRQTGGIDVLINNAGIIQVGPVEHMKVEDFADALAVHFWGTAASLSVDCAQFETHRAGPGVNFATASMILSGILSGATHG